MLNISAITRRTGVHADTIRKWEQRYGILQPDRTPGGQRRYSESDVARIEWLKARLDEGYRIGEAAALLDRTAISSASADELHNSFLDATSRSDGPGLAAVVDQALALSSLERSFTGVLAPALVEVGERWRAGRLTVAQEHLASAAVRSALERLLAVGRGSIRGAAVLTCAPGERHEIGLLMVAVLLRADGWQVSYLGADTPVADAASLATGLGASLLCFSAGSSATVTRLRRELERVRLPQTLSVLVGGRGTRGLDAVSAVHALRPAPA